MESLRWPDQSTINLILSIEYRTYRLPNTSWMYDGMMWRTWPILQSKGGHIRSLTRPASLIRYTSWDSWKTLCSPVVKMVLRSELSLECFSFSCETPNRQISKQDLFRTVQKVSQPEQRMLNWDKWQSSHHYTNVLMENYATNETATKIESAITQIIQPAGVNPLHSAKE